MEYIVRRRAGPCIVSGERVQRGDDFLRIHPSPVVNRDVARTNDSHVIDNERRWGLLLWAGRAPPEMFVVGRITRAIGHRENHAGSYRTGQLDSLLDLLVSRAELLRTCEVGDRSRFAMKGEDQSQVHQLLGLGVERSGGMDFLEVVGVALVGVEVAAAEIRHVSLLQTLDGDLSAAYNQLQESTIPREG